MSNLKPGSNKTGIIIKDGKKYLFRADVPFEYIFAWNIHDDIIHDRQMCHKWKKIDKRSCIFEYFDVDNPSETVSYIPF